MNLQQCRRLNNNGTTTTRIEMPMQTGKFHVLPLRWDELQEGHDCQERKSQFSPGKSSHIHLPIIPRGQPGTRVHMGQGKEILHIIYIYIYLKERY